MKNSSKCNSFEFDTSAFSEIKEKNKTPPNPSPKKSWSAFVKRCFQRFLAGLVRGMRYQML